MSEIWIKQYFDDGFSYSEILDFLQEKHGITISLTTLKRRLRKLNLRRKCINESSRADILYAVLLELESSGYNLGYKALWARLKSHYGLRLTRATAYRYLKIADPEGMAQRLGNKWKRRQYMNKGPNFVWHMDGHDKLKPFGFAIHGCIDGFSRKIIWLEVASSNNNPKIIAYYYLKAPREFNLLPARMRSDRGSENVVVESMQIAMRYRHDDNFSGMNSFAVGKSTANQRIEAYWRLMRQSCSDFYMQLFNRLRLQGEYDDSSLHKKCLQYCFGPLIKHDLLMTKLEWNKHRIRRQRNRDVVFGKPDVMYYLPHRYGSEDHKKPVNMNVVNRFLEEDTTKPHLIDPNFKELVELVKPDVTVPTNPAAALKLYKEILRLINLARCN